MTFVVIFFDLRSGFFFVFFVLSFFFIIVCLGCNESLLMGLFGSLLGIIIVFGLMFLWILLNILSTIR